MHDRYVSGISRDLGSVDAPKSIDDADSTTGPGGRIESHIKFRAIPFAHAGEGNHRRAFARRKRTGPGDNIAAKDDATAFDPAADINLETVDEKELADQGNIWMGKLPG